MASNVVHFEIPVNDIERAQKFYRGLFDWKIEGRPPSPATRRTT